MQKKSINPRLIPKFRKRQKNSMNAENQLMQKIPQNSKKVKKKCFVIQACSSPSFFLNLCRLFKMTQGLAEIVSFFLLIKKEFMFA
jgi:hypothetical protein